jgi:hypothetical protein
MHMNIISMHGRNAMMGSNPAALSQFQFRTTPEETTAPEKRYSLRFGGHKRERVAEVDACPQPLALQMRFTKEISDRRDSAMLTCHSYSSWAAEVTRLGRTRTQNSNRFASYQSCFVRSAWPHSANS